MRILSSYFSAAKGPFSAVQPKHRPEPIEDEVPTDEVDSSFGEGAPESGAGSSMSTDEMRRQGSRSAAHALAAFPQVVHLLTEAELPYGENLAAEVDLPLVSLGSPESRDLNTLLRQPEYQDGFIIEGIPSDLQEAQHLDSMLSATGTNERRVLSWDYSSQSHQDILDHYIDEGLLWMVPPCTDPSDAEQVKHALMDCLHGLPALQ